MLERLTIRRYLCVYLLHYLEHSTCVYFGLIGLASSILSALITILLCSTTDRYENYRLSYIFSVLLTLFSAFLLVKPVYHDLEYDNVELLSSNITTTTTTTRTNNSLSINNEEQSKIEGSNPLLVEIAFAFIFTTILLNNNLNSSIINRVSLLENKCLNSILIFGSFAGLMSSTVIVLVTSIVQLRSHFLLWPIVAFSFIIATSLTTIISRDENQSYNLNYNDDKVNYQTNKVEFKFSEKFRLFGNKTLLNCKTDFEIGIGISNPSIVTAKVSTIYPFDTKYDEVYRNIRRCSLAPLGDSFLLKQYELDDRKVGTRHFNNVTKVVPLEKVSENGLPNLGYRASFDNGNKSLILEIPSFSTSTANWIEKKDLSWLHLKLIKKLLKNDSKFIKLLMALILIGIVSSFNQYSFVWLYLMKSKVDNYDSMSFLNLSAYILICQQLSEILIYYYSYSATLKRLTLKYPTNFTFILSTYVIRYLLYLISEIYKNEILVNNSILIILVELLQGFQTSWLNLIIFELSIKFANESDGTLQKLANLGSIEKNENTTRKIKFRFTMTTICLFYCCLNGIGGGIGLLTGGLLIDLYGFTKLWFICSIFASIAGLFQYFMFQVKSF